MSDQLKKLVVDVRMINASGIGTDLQNLLPYLMRKYRLTLLGNSQEINQYEWAKDLEVISFTSPIYSISEQLLLPLVVPTCDIFLSPHFNVPFLPIKAKQRAVIIHDVYHLASTSINPIQKLYAKLLLTAAAKLSDKVITISDFTISEMKRYLNIGNKPVHKIILGVDKSRFNYTSHDSKLVELIRLKYNLPSKYMLYVGNVKPHKNLINVVEAIALLNSEQCIPLVVVGKKEGFLNADKQLYKLIQQKQLSNSIFFTGFVDNDHLPVVYQQADLFIFPSLYEGFGLPPLEAMACSCPTIVSDAASMPEVCKDASLYINARDPKQIAIAIQTLSTDDVLRNDLVKKGHYLIKEYSWEVAGQMLHSILSSETES
ncbi:glycosyltransferase family 4 protein [Pontibacter sp. H249]|uniref:glycosyltransferase family 4 protein n=1 Tax=Pontibacter sp. H249 TaxID=3133420 RepID=UPI0030BBFF9F